MTLDQSTYENFLRDFLDLIIERAKEARELEKAAKARGKLRDELFEGGRSSAYYEVISSLLHEAEAFGLSKEAVPGLSFDADRELL